MKTFWIFNIILYAIITEVGEAGSVEFRKHEIIPIKNAFSKRKSNSKIEKLYLDNDVSRDFEDNIDAMADDSNNNNNDNVTIFNAFKQYVKNYGSGSVYEPYLPFGAYPPPISYGHGSLYSVPPVPPYAAPPYVQAPYAAAPFAPAPYAPASFAPAPFAPAPFATAFQGYYAATTPASATTSSTTTAATTTTTTAGTIFSNLLAALNPITFITTTLPNIMMSNLFRVIAGILSFIGMFIFNGALGELICNITPLCNMAFNTLSIFMRRSLRWDKRKDLTPGKFVRSSIRKYRDMQKVYQPIEKFQFT